MSNKRNTLVNFWGSLLRVVGSPVVYEFPFFLITACIFCLKSTFQSFSSVLSSGNIDYAMLTAQRCFVGLLFSYLFAALAHSFKPRWAKVAVYAIMFLVVLIDCFLQANVHTGIGAEALRLVAETYSSEAWEFLQDYLFSVASLKAYTKVVIYLVAFIALTLLKNRIKHFVSACAISVINWITLLGLVVSLYFCECFVFMSELTTTEQMMSYCEYYNFPDPVSRMVSAIKTLRVAGRETQQAIEANTAIKPIESQQSNDSLNVVVVIGESFIKWHSPLYGYKLNTTPNMLNEASHGNLIAFDHVYSPASQTSLAIKNILSCNSVSDDEKWFEFPVFSTIFKQNGWRVYLWDNQRMFGQGSMWSFALNSFLYDNQLNNTAFSQNNTQCYNYDGELIDSFDADVSNGRNVVIFHLNGQHHDASSRYPHEQAFTRFTSDSIHRSEPWVDQKRKTAIAHYDNATLYNDFVLANIFKKFQETNSIVLYFSDHGEEIYDYRDNRGRKLDGEVTPNLCKYIFEVPFFVWVSNQFVSKYPHKVQALEKAKSKTFSTDNICHLLFDIANISTQYYKPERDVMQDDFKGYIPVSYFGEKKRPIIIPAKSNIIK
ncbi:MAG: phosphoethanolamine transferase [Muribaculaceae bacterium]|nr:phosphoethanolamine transferase [Muribaculaceae bacterium]